MKSGIYCIENLINGKKYIGLAIDIEKRWKRHLSELTKNKHSNTHLQNSWDKYGCENFDFWIIAEYAKEMSILSTMEIYFISYYSSFIDEFGYNMTMGGEGTLGSVQSPETIKKRSDKTRGKNHWNYGNNLSDETKEKIRISLSGEKNPNFGKTLSEETKALISENHADFSGENHPLFGKHHSEETKKKIGKKNKNRIVSPEEREQKSKTAKDVWKNEKEIGKTRASRVGKKRPNSASVYMGVGLSRKAKGWSVNSCGKYIGFYKDEIEAAKAYDKYIIENNLPYTLNFPDDNRETIKE